jgi:hypothetical protein
MSRCPDPRNCQCKSEDTDQPLRCGPCLK